MSLLALLFSYDAIAGERERGTLRALLANSMPRSVLLLAKILSGFICLMLPLVFSTIVGLILVHVFSGESFSGEDWKRFGLIFLVSSVYVMLFFIVGLLLSILCRGSKTALLASFFIWITLILIVPNLSVLVAAHARPVSSKTEMLERKRLIEAQEDDKMVMRMLKTSREGGTEVIARDSSQWAFEMATNVSARLRSIEDAHVKQLEQQSSLAQSLSLVSPASAYSYMAMDLAGTGLRAESSFRDQLRNHNPIFTEYIKSKIENENDVFAVVESSETVNISDMPRFRYQGESLTGVVSGVKAYASQLIICSCVLFAGCFFAFSRSDVRDEF
jgi:ABC-type transport system involved in multi-copper enzyme maturation permease subunit